MTDRRELLRVIAASIHAANEMLEPGVRLGSDEDARLFGGGSPLDSLGLASLVLDVEQRLSIELGLEVSLADERALSQSRSPYRSVRTLADYIETLIGEDHAQG